MMQLHSENDSAPGELKAALEQIERMMILEALHSTRGNSTKAAKRLGITERIMRLRTKKYGIDCKQFRTKM